MVSGLSIGTYGYVAPAGAMIYDDISISVDSDSSLNVSVEDDSSLTIIIEDE